MSSLLTRPRTLLRNFHSWMQLRKDCLCVPAQKICSQSFPMPCRDVNRNYGEKYYFQPKRKGRSWFHLVVGTICGAVLGREYWCQCSAAESLGILFDSTETVSRPAPRRLGFRSQYNFIADVVEKVVPAVVYIEIRDNKQKDIFTGKPVVLSNGSGFIVREDGLIVTNAHVVFNNRRTEVEVKLNDGSTFPGVVEDVDVELDLATVRIKARNLPIMLLGSSRALRNGEFVVALGSPLSLNNTVTSGVVSSVSRGSEEIGLDKEMAYIQTDASVTFGNSGGPLVNLDGEAIGINALKVTAGISFAIPIDYAKLFLKRNEERRQKKEVKPVPVRRYLGIVMLTLTSQLIHELQAKNHQLPGDVTFGVLVWKIVVGSPAQLAGIRPGDIIVDVNGTAVHGASNIYAMLDGNQDLRLVIVRGTKRITITAKPTLEPQPPGNKPE